MLLRLSRRLGLPLLGASAALAVVFGAGTASGQTGTITIGKVDRSTTPRQSTYHPLWINYSDCVADGTITFSVTLPSPAWQTDLLQVWVGSGTDCTDSTQRTSTTATCWEVYSGQPTTGTALPVTIRMQDIVGQHKPGKPGSGTPPDCEKASSTTTPTAVTLYFMLMSSGGQIDPAVTPAQYTDLKFDLLGPDPPTNVNTGIAENQLKVTWNPASTLLDTVGYDVFCDPKPGSTTPSWNGTGGDGGTTDAGGTGASGSDAGSVDGAVDAALDGSAASDAAASDAAASDAAASDAGSEAVAKNPKCPSTVLLEGKRPDPAYLCGSVNGATNTSTYAKGLSNGTYYAVAVAGIDGVQNYGPLSAVQCGQPQPVNDFWDKYTQAGGKGGGGFCGITDKPAPGAGGALLLALFAGILRRRRRQRS